MTKECSKCGIEKVLTEFHFRKDINAFRAECKLCRNLQKRQHYIKNADGIKLYQNIYRKNNPEKLIALNKKYYENNLEKAKEYRKRYYEKNKNTLKEKNKIWCKNNQDKILENKKEYYIKNSDVIKQKIQKYQDIKRKTDINYRISCNLRTRVRHAVSFNQRAGSAVDDLGCSIKQFKEYLESKFYNNKETGEAMTWENYGFYGWHFDHIKPLIKFDLTDREQFLKAAHYTNYQPLWARDNFSKHDNWEGE
jgi:hypothetical protein